jgi:hypothetical protein
MKSGWRKIEGLLRLAACRGLHCPICKTYLCALARRLAVLREPVECLARARRRPVLS